MGEAKHRRAARIRAAPTRHEIEQGFRTIQTEGDGVYTLTLVSREGALKLLSRALDGDRIARVQLDAISRVVQLVQRNSPERPLCLLCGGEFRRSRLPVLFGFLQAHRDDPTAIVANAICAECSAKHPTCEAMSSAVAELFRANLIPDLRVLPQPVSEAGHA